MNCRHCGNALGDAFLDLGHAPPSNAYLSTGHLDAPELTYPLRLHVCDRCWLVQTHGKARPDELFASDYAYFSSTSRTWLEHAARYFDMARERFALDDTRSVVEIGSNDGYLLRNFVKARIPCLGIEPTAGTAAAAEALGIPVRREFFTDDLAKRLVEEGHDADLVVGNNVYAHVPDINDFTAGLKTLLKQGGVVTLEFPHVMRMIEQTQFDTAYHEHFSYLSLFTVISIFLRAGLRVFDVQQLVTHGGSLRVFGCHADDPRETEPAVATLLATEEGIGLRTETLYSNFQARADRIKDDLLDFLIKQKRSGRHVAAYGAAAKGNTFLNYAGVKPDLLPYVCDAAASKQGKFLPGSHIPVLHPSALVERRPEILLILAWNIAKEVIEQERSIKKWGGRFALASPRLEIVDA
jgi:SAM-dependent methyltransferase